MLSAEEAVPTVASNAREIKTVQRYVDFVWILVAAFLVFFMQAGFAMVEAGFTRAKNAVNIIMKNLLDMSVGAIAYWAIGFGIMFGISKTGWFGTTGFFLSDFTHDRDPLDPCLLDVSGGFLCHCRNHCLRSHGREDKICSLSHIFGNY